MNTPRIIVPDCGINFDRLAKQKLVLLEEIEERSIELDRLRDSEQPREDLIGDLMKRIEHLTGILHMIDAMQDDAVDNLKIWEFPKLKKFTMRHELIREMLVEVEAFDEEEAYRLMAEHVEADAPADWDTVSRRTVIIEVREE